MEAVFDHQANMEHSLFSDLERVALLFNILCLFMMPNWFPQNTITYNLKSDPYDMLDQSCQGLELRRSRKTSKLAMPC